MLHSRSTVEWHVLPAVTQGRQVRTQAHVPHAREETDAGKHRQHDAARKGVHVHFLHTISCDTRCAKYKHKKVDTQRCRTPCYG